MTPLLCAILLSLPLPVVQEKIPWHSGNLDSALAEAKSKNVLLMTFFRAEKDEASDSWSRVLFSDDRVAAALANLVCARVDVQKENAVALRHGVKKPPALLWFNPDGTTRDRLDSVSSLDAFLGELARIRADIGTINDVRRKVAAQKDDVDLRLELHRRLKAVGDEDGSNEQKSAIARLDPEGTSRAARHFRYQDITSAIEEHWAKTRDLSLPKIEELRIFVEMESDPELVWDGAMRLVNTYDYLANKATEAGKPDEAKKYRATRREFAARAWLVIPQVQDVLHRFCFQQADSFLKQQDELSADDKKFLERLTARMVTLFEDKGMAHDMRARALMLVGRREEALQAAKKAVEVDPANQQFQDRVKQILGG